MGLRVFSSFDAEEYGELQQQKRVSQPPAQSFAEVTGQIEREIAEVTGQIKQEVAELKQKRFEEVLHSSSSLQVSQDLLDMTQANQKAIQKLTKTVEQMGNPQPYDFEVLLKELHGNTVLVKLRYPGCHSYGGVKILVYDDVQKFETLLATKVVDPHFLESVYSPVARFEPTARGLEVARAFARTLDGFDL